MIDTLTRYIKNARLIPIISVCAILLLLTEQNARPAINEALIQHEQRLIIEIFATSKPISIIQHSENRQILCKNNQALGYVDKIRTADGYSGAITFVVGFGPTNDIKALRVIEHRETPGLGDKVEKSKSDWVDQFDKQKTQPFIQQQWAVRKDGGKFDQLTAATVTSRAIVNALAQHLQQNNAPPKLVCHE